MEFMMSTIEASSFLNSDFAFSTLPLLKRLIGYTVARVAIHILPNFIYVGLLGFMLAISLQLIVPQKIKGRVLSTMALVAASLMPLGTIIYGVLYDLGGYWLINLVSGG